MNWKYQILSQRSCEVYFNRSNYEDMPSYIPFMTRILRLNNVTNLTIL